LCKHKKMAENLRVKTKENPKLQQAILADGRKSLHLEYYLGYSVAIDKKTGKEKIKHDRRKETLNLYLLSNPKTIVYPFFRPLF
jgi:hypothetical protein